MNNSRTQLLVKGFSLVEVMVALVIIAVGMLGIAKIQALAFASTGSASTRSIAAIQAASLAASMHVDKGYWAAGLAPAAAITIVGTTITSTDAALSAATDCTSAGGAQPVCLPRALAAYDLQNWARALNAVIPGPSSTITCTTVTPVTCTIQITWTENLVSVNAQGANGVAMQAPTYTLLVEP